MNCNKCKDKGKYLVSNITTNQVTDGNGLVLNEEGNEYTIYDCSICECQFNKYSALAKVNCEGCEGSGISKLPYEIMKLKPVNSPCSCTYERHLIDYVDPFAAANKEINATSSPAFIRGIKIDDEFPVSPIKSEIGIKNIIIEFSHDDFARLIIEDKDGSFLSYSLRDLEFKAKIIKEPFTEDIYQYEDENLEIY